MNQMTAIYNVSKDKPVVRYFEGADGLEALDRHGRSELKKSKEYLAISPIDLIEKLFPSRREKSMNERIALGITARTIYTHEGGRIPNDINKKELREGIFIPRSLFPLNATLNVYPSWGIKIFYFDNNKPYGVSIESKDIANNFKLYFELAWQGAKSYQK